MPPTLVANQTTVKLKTVGPKPAPVPPAQPVAATAKPKPKLPYCGAQLPRVALTAVVVPRDAKVVSGTLLHDANRKTGRPLVMLCVPCTCHDSSHTYPWRSDWPVDASVRSHQRSRCRKHKGPYGVWLGIDPERIGRSQEVVRLMRAELTTWKMVQLAEKAKKRVPTPQETANV